MSVEDLDLYALFIRPPGELVGYCMKQDAKLDEALSDPLGLIILPGRGGDSGIYIICWCMNSGENTIVLQKVYVSWNMWETKAQWEEVSLTMWDCFKVVIYNSFTIIIQNYNR